MSSSLRALWLKSTGLFFAVLTLDLITKQMILQKFAYGESLPVTAFFHLTYVRNTGSAFGLFQDNNLALLIVSFVILGVLAFSARGLIEQTGAWGQWALPLILSGAVGNIIDRFLYGYVVDFLDFRVWPVFNVADSAISIGTAMLALGMMRSKR